VKTPKPILERRRSVRIQEALPFRIDSKGYDFQAVTINISCHGALCFVDKDIALMTQLDIALPIPGIQGSSRKQPIIHLRGVVVRKEKDSVSGKYCIAVFFSRVKPRDEKLLKKFIDSRLKA